MSGITLIAQMFVHCLSVLTNMFGIYCLRRQRKHRRHHTEGHSLLMQNLACIEIVKMAYEMIPMVVRVRDCLPQWCGEARAETSR